MKTFILFSAIVLSSQAMSSEVLLNFTRGSGFGPTVSRSSLVVTSDGEVTKKFTQLRLVRSNKIGKLTANAVANLKDKIETIADEGKLINLDAKRPQCADAPSSSLIVNKGGKEIVIAARRACQNHETKDLETKALLNLVQSFEYIAE